ncbi:hypothetical protein ROJ8625_04020 [Roseivivax jejudonensis]|uniref:Uncharacterized protein n=1 Tax=Roseivivax jejudonensis TaxID=1529041 RepID=A0A1X7AAI7_9RHOB|nr:hypothetical protein [Roseivivax jejudonensis]SLN74175.1 hypothetical protein ROJ8625_04020 [Roseivivax jejudonensis]
MKTLASFAIVCALATPAMSAAPESPVAAAERLNVCEDRAVASARWLEDSRLEVTCSDDEIAGAAVPAGAAGAATNVAPLFGGLAPILGGVAAAGALAAAGGNGGGTSNTSSTSSTSGTN